ncbi:MAG: hypothetical protein ACR2J1_00005, partial [Methyloceanibacter sp.]|uniref:hypothetical protein n=1 Tax=Methyloceanibacter sp. TaxID=1965321 RepID=UPI003D9BEE1E
QAFAGFLLSDATASTAWFATGVTFLGMPDLRRVWKILAFPLVPALPSRSFRSHGASAMVRRTLHLRDI